MLQTRRDLARIFRQTYRRSQRRNASSTHPPGEPSSHSASAGQHGPAHHAHHPEPVNESFGRGFYLTVAALPLSFAIYKFSRSTDGSSADSAQPLITRFIKSFSHWGETWEQRNSLHTAMIEQAAHDRNLFHSSPGSKHVDLKFPEIFNTGSPYNVPAGHTANMDQLIAHYKQRNAKVEEARVAKMKAAAESGRDQVDPSEAIVRRGTY